MKHCELCGGEGTVQVDVFDPDSGQMMRGVGTRQCICRGKLKLAEDEMDDDSEWKDVPMSEEDDPNIAYENFKKKA